MSLALPLACGGGGFPDGLSEEQVKALGVTQGVVGNAWFRTGDCSLGLSNRCSSAAIVGTVAAFVDAGTPTDSDRSCEFNPSGKPFAGSPRSIDFPRSFFPPASAGEDQTDSEGAFGISLPPGAYTLVLIDSTGCTRIADSVSELIEQPFDVQPNAVVEENVRIDWRVAR